MNSLDNIFSQVNSTLSWIDRFAPYLASKRKNRVGVVVPSNYTINQILDEIWDSEGYTRYIRHINNTENVIYGQNSAIYLFTMDNYERMRGLKFDAIILQQEVSLA